MHFAFLDNYFTPETLKAYPIKPIKYQAKIPKYQAPLDKINYQKNTPSTLQSSPIPPIQTKLHGEKFKFQILKKSLLKLVDIGVIGVNVY